MFILTTKRPCLQHMIVPLRQTMPMILKGQYCTCMCARASRRVWGPPRRHLLLLVRTWCVAFCLLHVICTKPLFLATGHSFCIQLFSRGSDSNLIKEEVGNPMRKIDSYFPSVIEEASSFLYFSRNTRHLKL